MPRYVQAPRPSQRTVNRQYAGQEAGRRDSPGAAPVITPGTAEGAMAAEASGVGQTGVNAPVGYVPPTNINTGTNGSSVQPPTPMGSAPYQGSSQEGVINPNTGQSYEGAAGTRLTNRLTKKKQREEQLAGIVGYNETRNPWYNDKGEVGGYTTTKEVSEQKTAELRQKQMETWAQEDKNLQTDQKTKMDQTRNAGGATGIPTTKTPTAPVTPPKGPDFSTVDPHLSVINAMIQADPVLAATYTPILSDLTAKRARIENDYNASLTDLDNEDKNQNGVSDGVESAYTQGVAATERRANESDRINQENKSINLEAARVAKELGQIAQSKFELQQHRTEQLQIENNVEMERKNRLVANKLGVAAGGNGMRWMADEIRKGVQSLTYLQESGSLQEAEFALRIGSEYSLSVRQATNGYDAQKLQIDSQFAAEIKDLKGMVTLDSKERKLERKSIVQEYLKALNENDEKFAEQVQHFNKTLSDEASEMRKMKAQDAAAEKRASAQEEASNKRMRFQEAMQNQRLGVQLSNQERMQLNTDKKMEKQEEKLVRSEFSKVAESQTVKDYATLRNTEKKIADLVADAKANPWDRNKTGAAIQLAMTLTAKGSDPTTGVRDGELKKFGMSQGAIDKMKTFGKVLTGGDMTGITVDAVEAYAQAMTLLSETQKEEAQAEYVGAINRLVEFNAGSAYYNIDPATISLPNGIAIPDWAAKAYYEDLESEGDSYFDVNWDDETSWTGGETNFGKELVSMGTITQDFDSPIASRDEGGLYEPSTVLAWGGKHAGLDIAVPQDSPFKSIVEGEIIEIGEEPGWGGTVVIKDPRGAEHRVAHLSALNPNLKIGDRVPRGSFLARTGGAKGAKGSGNSTGPHVDYRIRYRGEYVNPLTYNPYA